MSSARVSTFFQHQKGKETKRRRTLVLFARTDRAHIPRGGMEEYFSIFFKHFYLFGVSSR